MNEAETRAEHIDPALRRQAGVSLRGATSAVSIRSPSAGSKARAARQGAHRRLCADVPQHQAGRGRGQGVGRSADRRSCASEELRRQARHPLHLRQQRPGNLRHRHADGREGELPCIPRPKNSGAAHSPKQNAWRDRFAAVPFEDGAATSGRYYQDIAIERVLAAIADGQQRILLTLATGTGKTFIAFQIAWKLFQSRWNLSRGSRQPPSAHPVPRRSQHPGRPGLQRLLRLPRRCAWCASSRRTSARRARCRRTAACSSPSSRPS